MASEEVKQDNTRRAKTAQDAHQKANVERAQNENELRASYARIKEEPAYQDILDKGKQFAGYHLKMAKDGVGYRETGGKDESGNPIQETVFFEQPKRVTELDKAAGIEELATYIENRTEADRLKPVKVKKVVSEEQ